MLMNVIVLCWTALGIAWWSIAWYLVAAYRRQATNDFAPAQSGSLSIFKPLPVLGARGLQIEAAGLESFIRQLDESTELLLGIHESDRACVMPFVEGMQKKYPQAQLQIIFHDQKESAANPKIVWQRILVRYAKGDLWLWSDADIVIPPHFLKLARKEFAQCGARLLTFPYAVSQIPSQASLFDALFVNVEFLPGVLLLRRFGQVDFGLGAAMLFKREDFLQQVDWQLLDQSLADDFVLGQLLQPVCIGSMIVTTATDSNDWTAALKHYLRWAKTIRWCRPVGYAGQILALPIIGWMACVCLHPLTWWSWLGLVGMVQLDVFFARQICSNAGCSLSLRNLLVMEIWSLGRALSWMLCWLPFPVTWRTQTWCSPQVRLEDPL